jgi:transposase
MLKVSQLEKENAVLRSEIQLLKNNRNSNTSSTPPSQDFGRSNQKSLRQKTGKKSGGQKDHEGKNLQMTSLPDEIIEHKPHFCKECGEELNNQNCNFVSRKQEVDLPPVLPRYVEHQSYSCKCRKCGATTTTTLPERLKASIQYGDNIKALIVYLSVYHYLPYNRISELLQDFLNLPLSEGTIDNILKECSGKAYPAYEEIRKKVQNALVVGGDETGIKINGKKGWLFAFQNQNHTFLSASMSRGFQSISNVFGNGFPHSVYVSDCLPAQLKVESKAKQLCMAHLQRELANFIDVFDCGFSSQLSNLIHQAIELKYRLSETEYVLHKNKIKYFRTKLDKLLNDDHEGKHKKVLAFIKRLRKHRDFVFTFLQYPEVPPDNNGSERAIRNAKVKMKVSGQFRSLAGAESFAILRSIIDTAKKNSQNVLNVLAHIPKVC